MKRLLITSLCAAAALMGITACNNGAYTATPNTDQSSVHNPFDKSLFYKTLLGTWQGKIDGKDVIFHGSYIVDGNGNRIMQGAVVNDSIFFRKVLITVPDASFKGAKGHDVVVTVQYSKYDTAIKRDKYFENVQMNLNDVDDADNKLLGVFSGLLTRTEPPPADPTDTARFDQMVLYLQKNN